MKTHFLKMAVASIIFALGTTGPVFAQTPPATTESHEHDHESAPASEKKEIPASGMMGGTNMEDMHAMKSECMKSHKDGKMCDHQMMEKCQSKMGKAECQKMMKKSKM